MRVNKRTDERVAQFFQSLDSWLFWTIVHCCLTDALSLPIICSFSGISLSHSPRCLIMSFLRQSRNCVSELKEKLRFNQMKADQCTHLFRTAKNREASTGPLACLFAPSLAPLTLLIAPHCSLRSRTPLHSFIHSLIHSLSSSWESERLDVLKRPGFVPQCNDQ